MEPSEQPAVKRSSRTATELYRSCMNLAEAARSLLVQNEHMKRLGLNAQVLAAQASDEGRALEVIVSDIGRLSRAIRDVLEALGNESKSLSASSIEALHLSHLNAAYALGRSRGIAPRSEAIYGKTHAASRARGKRNRMDLKGRIRAVSAMVEDLGRAAQQIPPVNTMIRIVLGETTLKTKELLDTVEELKAFHGNLDAKVEHMRLIRQGCSEYIQEMEKEDR